MNIVTDGNIVFKNYYQLDGQIYSKKTNKKLNGKSFCLHQDGKAYRRQKHSLLLRIYNPQLFVQDGQYIDVFGFEDQYCFKKDNPNIIWSKKYNKQMSVFYTKKGHVYFSPYKNKKQISVKHIHDMVWQSYNKKSLPQGYHVHHISFDKKQNNYENLMLLPENIHHAFHAKFSCYTKGFTTKENFINTINNYKISYIDKQRLIATIV